MSYFSQRYLEVGRSAPRSPYVTGRYAMCSVSVTEGVYSLCDCAAFVDIHSIVSDAWEFAQWVARFVLELLRGLLAHSVREFDFVGDAELFEQPCGSNGTGGLQKPQGYWL